MNITIYTNSDFPYGGAPENFIRQMALGLHACGENIKVVRLRGRMYGGNNDTGIPCSNILFPQRPQNELLKLLELISIILFSPISVIISKLRLKTKVIILYGFEYSYYSMPFYITSKLFNLKIYHIITDYYDTKSIVPVWWKRPKVFFYERQFKRIDKKFNGIVVLSNYLKEHAIKNGVHIEKILVIPHFIDIQAFAAEKETRKQDAANVIIGFCGTPSISNGILDLIEAFNIVNKKFDHIKLLIIGSLSKEVKSIIAEMLNNSNKQNIIFTGFLSKEEVKTQLNRCAILINPRKAGRFAEAGFPTKLGEYFATKRPVVATAVGDLKNYFKNQDELILVEPNLPVELANGIILLLSNKILSNQIGQKGYDWALNNLDHIKNSYKLIDFISRT